MSDRTHMRGWPTQWTFGAAAQHPAAVNKWWGHPAAATRRLSPQITYGPNSSFDGHVPDCQREVLLPPSVMTTTPGSSAERDIMAQAIVLRGAVIWRNPPDDSDYHLRGYRLHNRDPRSTADQKEDEVGFLPCLTRVDHDPTQRLDPPRFISRDPRVAQIRDTLSSHRTIDLDPLLQTIATSAPDSLWTDHWATLIAVVIDRNMGRGIDLYRSYGHALLFSFDILDRDRHGLDHLLPLLDAGFLVDHDLACHDSAPGRLAGDILACHLSRPQDQPPLRSHHPLPRPRRIPCKS